MNRVHVIEVVKRGAQGVPGKSAYDLAVIEGFRGTRAEWLASLKGEKGEKGEAGEDAMVSMPTKEQFPTFGKNNKLYYAEDSSVLYAWNNSRNEYADINSLNIKIIKCGDANG